MNMSTCLECVRGFHEECEIDSPCCCKTTSDIPQKPFTSVDEPLGVRDVTISAGRKEAARLYPIDKTANCEWQGLANCGGGEFPIIGCIAGKQIARHHGPHKNTSDNRRENIHLICKSCHERWHAANNPGYEAETYLRLPHKPRVATKSELASVKSWVKPAIVLVDEDEENIEE